MAQNFIETKILTESIAGENALIPKNTINDYHLSLSVESLKMDDVRLESIYFSHDPLYVAYSAIRMS